MMDKGSSRKRKQKELEEEKVIPDSEWEEHNGDSGDQDLASILVEV